MILIKFVSANRILCTTGFTCVLGDPTADQEPELLGLGVNKDALSSVIIPLPTIDDNLGQALYGKLVIYVHFISS
jgi:hypothetical protein